MVREAFFEDGDGMDGGAGAPNELHVAVVQARDLPIMDKNFFGKGGSSDPLVVLRVGDRVAKSTTKTKTLTPVWEETFILPVPEVEAEDGGALIVDVEDWDQMSSNDLIGRVAISLEELLPKNPVRRWFTLTDKDGKAPPKPLGEVELEVRWVHSPALSTSFFTEVDLLPSTAPNKLCVAVVQCVRLTALDKGAGGKATSDPVVTVKVGDSKWKTAVKKGTLSPVWNEQTSFPVATNDGDTALPVVEVVVEDWDRLSNDFIGCVRIPLEQLKTKEVHRQWFALQGNEPNSSIDVARGKIELAFRWVTDPDLVPKEWFPELDLSDKPCNELRIGVVGARNLKVMDKNLIGKGGSSDPLAVLRVGSEEFKTQVKKQSCNPTWNESFEAYLPLASSAEATLRVMIEDWDRASSNDPIGYVDIPIAPLVDKKVHRKWYTLTDAESDHPAGCGDVELVLSYWHNSEKEWLTEDDIYPDKPPNLLRVAVIRANGLPIMDKNMVGKGGSSDPRVALRVGDREAKTTTKKKTLTPVWNEVIEIEVDTMSANVEVIVEDVDALSDADYMGRVSLDLKSLVDKQAERGTFKLLPPQGTAGASSDLGEIELVARWVYSPEAHGEFFGEYDGTAAVENAKPPNELKIAVISARNLPIMDKNMFGNGGSSDPQMVLRCGDQTGQTSVIKKCLDPQWGEIITLSNITLGGKQSPVLEVIAQDVDAMSSADVMGTCEIPIVDLHDRATKRGWWPLVDEGKDRGEVELALRWIHNAELEPELFADEEQADKTARAPNQLLIAVCQARDLVAKDKKLFGGKPSSDPVVSITVDAPLHGASDAPTVLTSTVQTKTLSPVWNENFRVTLRAEEIDKHRLSKAQIRIVVEDWDMIGNDFLGETRISLAKLLDKHTERQWFPLQSNGDSPEEVDGEEIERGEILLVLKWVFSPAIDPDFFTHFDPDPAPQCEANEVHVALVKARDLPIMDQSLFRKGGSADPVVTLSCGGRTCRSTVKKSTLAPEWNETFSFSFDVEEDPSATLDLLVEDWDALKSDPIGTVRIPLQPCHDKVTRRRTYDLEPLAADATPHAATTPHATQRGASGGGGAATGGGGARIELVLKAVYNAELATERESLEGRVQRAKRKWGIEDSTTELSLRRGAVSAVDASLISAVLVSPVLALVKLDLRTSQMGALEVTAVANGLAENGTLIFLNLSGNDLNDCAIVSGEDEQAKLPPNGGLVAMGACLRNNTTLQKLDLSENCIEAKGLAALAAGLKDNVSLTELKLSRNKVVNVNKCAWGFYDAVGLTALGEALKFNHTLINLNLAQNQLCGLTEQAKGRFNSSGILALAPRLRFNNVVKQINLSDNALIEGGLRPIIEEIASNSGFKLAERLDKGKRRYCILRRGADLVRKFG